MGGEIYIISEVRRQHILDAIQAGLSRGCHLGLTHHQCHSSWIPTITSESVSSLRKARGVPVLSYRHPFPHRGQLVEIDFRHDYAGHANRRRSTVVLILRRLVVDYDPVGPRSVVSAGVGQELPPRIVDFLGGNQS